MGWESSWISWHTSVSRWHRKWKHRIWKKKLRKKSNHLAKIIERKRITATCAIHFFLSSFRSFHFHCSFFFWSFPGFRRWFFFTFLKFASLFLGNSMAAAAVAQPKVNLSKNCWISTWPNSWKSSKFPCNFPRFIEFPCTFRNWTQRSLSGEIVTNFQTFQKFQILGQSRIFLE